jgi:hypothetical protein
LPGGQKAGSGKYLPQFFLPVTEDPLHVSAHKERVDQPATDYAVPHHVLRERAAVALGKGVLMNPGAVRPAPLLVHKAARGLPGGDFTLPPQGKPAQPQAVINPQTGAHFNRARCQHLELQPGRGEGFEIERIGEEGKDLFAPAWKPLFGFQGEEAIGSAAETKRVHIA